MTKRRQPAKPRIIGESPFNLEALRLDANKDVKLEKADRRHIERAVRLDVFSMMHQRGTVSPEQLTAIRRLETDLHLAAGVANTDDRAGTSSGGCQERVTQRMIDASGRVQLVLNDLPAGHARLLDALLSPEGHGSVLTRWRAHVERIFGKRDKEAQADVIHWTCAAVTEAYAALDYERRCA